MAQKSNPFDHLHLLPHWARVAFAARCGQSSLRLFDLAWPDASPIRRQALVDAIELARNSAAIARAREGLREAYLNACIVAGVIWMGHEQSPELHEPVPHGGENCLIASFAAKVAEMAARAAIVDPEESLQFAEEAFSFAVNASQTAQRFKESRREWEQDFGSLLRAASRSRWDDRSPMAPSFFEGPAHEPPRSWWRFW